MLLAVSMSSLEFLKVIDSDSGTGGMYWRAFARPVVYRPRYMSAKFIERARSWSHVVELMTWYQPDCWTALRVDCGVAAGGSV